MSGIYGIGASQLPYQSAVRGDSPQRAGAQQAYQKIDPFGGGARIGGADKVSNSFSGMSAGSATQFSISAQLSATFQGEITFSGPNGRASASYQAQMDLSVQVNGSVKGAGSVQDIGAVGGDMSPDAVSQRIVDFALGFFPMFAADNPDMSQEEQVEAFREMVGSAVGEGMQEAMSMLGNIPSEVSSALNETIDLVQQKLDAFFDNLLKDGAKAGQEAAGNGSWRDFVQEFFNSYGEEQQTQSEHAEAA